jgi:hypothetical protein
MRNGDGRQIMHKILKRTRRQRLKILSVVGDTAYNFLAC